jgi:hypothetical protein
MMQCNYVQRYAISEPVFVNVYGSPGIDNRLGIDSWAL